MASADDIRPGTMAAVIGLEDSEVIELCDHATVEMQAVVQAANFNAPGQVVISGDMDSIFLAGEMARERGARKVVPLKVGGAFHSPLMQFAREGLEEALGGLEITEPTCPVYMNVTARPTVDPEEIRRLLLRQLTSTVLWSRALRNMRSDGADRFVEVGPGRVLAGLVKRTLGREVVTETAGAATDAIFDSQIQTMENDE